MFVGKWPPGAASLMWMALGASLLGGCARVAETTSYTQTKLSSRTEVDVVLRSLEYSETSKLEGQALLISLRQQELCSTSVIPRYRKEAHIHREARDDVSGYALAPATTSLLGGLLAGSGAYGYLDAEQLAAERGDPETTPDDYRRAGLVLGVAGVALLGIAVIDLIRLRDEDRVVGDVDGPAAVTQAPCREGPAKHVELVATVEPTTWSQLVTTDAAGKARIELRELPEEAFGQRELVFSIEIDKRTQTVSLPVAETSALLARLAADPSSRLAMDRVAKLQAQCDKALAAAAANSIDGETLDAMVEQVESAWANARAQCGPRWTPSQEEARQKVQAQIAATAKQRAATRCAEEVAHVEQTLAELLEEDEPQLPEGLHASATEKCQGAPNAEKLLAGLLAKEKSARETMRRAEVARAALVEIEEHWQERDAVAIRRLARNSDVAAVLRSLPGTRDAFQLLAEHWIGALERGNSGAGVRAQLCAARALVQSFVGNTAWARYRAAAVKRNDLVKGATLARELSLPGCK